MEEELSEVTMLDFRIYKTIIIQSFARNRIDKNILLAPLCTSSSMYISLKNILNDMFLLLVMTDEHLGCALNIISFVPLISFRISP